jgi:uncharacterized cupredoxin-like copper-binding protein
MSVSKRLGALILVTGLSLVIGACNGGDTEASTPVTDSEFSFGSPAQPADADRTVEITVTDSLAFEPAELTVAAGETITFRIVNPGSVTHDLTLGDQVTQDEHEAEMAEMGDMTHDEPNVVTIPAGETKELTWAFPDSGTVLIGCHEPGHYAAGMKGQITIDA